MNKINERVRKIRKQNKYTQAKTALLLNLKASGYSKKESKGNFLAEELLTLAEFFKVDVRQFFYDDVDAIKPYIIIPDECYMLNEREGHLITMYRNSSKEKKKEMYAAIFNIFTDK